MSRSTAFWPVLAATAGLLACIRGTGPYTWVDDYTPPAAPSAKEYVIEPGDLINVRVYNQDALAGRARVRADGMISLPFLNDVQAAGSTPSSLAARLQARLKEYLLNPVVTVSLEEPRPFEVYVMGEVGKSGRYALEPGATVIQAIAAAGGLTAFASRDRVFVVRQEPAPVRIRFRYHALTRLEGKASAFRLRSGDTVVVE